MAVDLPEVHAQALDHTRRYVAGVGDDQWGIDSACAGWDIHTMVNHIVGGNLWVPELMGAKTIEEVGDALDGDLLGSDPVAVYDASAAGAAAAFRAPGAMDVEVAVSYGRVPGSVYCGHRFVDVLIHGWDVAKPTGQDTNLPEDLVDACFEVIEPQMAELHASGMFQEIPVPAGADRQATLLAMLGRED